MSNGKFGSADLAATTDTLLYTVGAGLMATANIRLTNRNALSSAAVRVAIGTGGAPATTDYIEYDFQLTAGGIVEDIGIFMSTGEKVWARSSNTGVSAVVRGSDIAADGSGFMASRNLVIADGAFLLFTNSATKSLTANMRFCNRNFTSAKVRLNVGSGGAPVAAEWMEYDALVSGNGIIEDTAITIGASEKVWVQTDTDGISLRLYGLLEIA